jgi:hypothetical protein
LAVWSCSKCGAALTVPADPAMSMSRCDFCGEDNVAPDVARRQELQLERIRADERKRIDDLERARLDELRSARVAAIHERKSESRWLYISIGIGIVAITGALVINGLTGGGSSSSAPANKPTDAKSTGKTHVKEIVDGKLKHGCRVINEARTVDDVATISNWKLPKGSCVTIVAATGIDDNVLTIQFLDDEGSPVSQKHSGKELVEVFCPEETAKYGYRISPAATMPFTFEELQCEDP